MAFSKTSKLKPRHTDLMQYVIFYINVAFEFSIFFPNQPPWFESTDMKKPIISGQILHSENGNFRYFSKCIIREARLQLVLISHVYLYMECSIHLVWTYAFILKKNSHIELWKIEHKCWTWEKNWKCNNIKSKKYKSISFFICTSFSEYLVKDVKKRRLSKPKSLFPLCGRHENRGKELVLADIVILTQLIYGKLQRWN